MAIVYDYGTGNYKNWVVAENSFNPEYLGKFETIFSLGNGFMGLRAATEEHYTNEKRGFYIAGLYDQFPGEVPELVNIPDLIEARIILAGELFNLKVGKIISYNRRLNLKDGQLIREIKWQSPKGNITRLIFKRFVSIVNLHIAVLQIKIVPLNYSGTIKIKTGINAQITNSGIQHLIEEDKGAISSENLYMVFKTLQSDIVLAVATRYKFSLNNKNLELKKGEIKNKTRQLHLDVEYEVDKENEFLIDKIISVYTSRDFKFVDGKKDKDIGKTILDETLECLNKTRGLGYRELFEQHKKHWNKLWKQMDIQIRGVDFDQLAIRFAQFHLIQMTPKNNTEISVAAKGLSGEGYRGHIFWDTEIFILPFLIYKFPKIARNLLLYRYHTLDGARKKAREYGWKGAMYPWESIDSGEETTPKYMDWDIKTGKLIRIWCGEIEQHITSDIAYAIWHYFVATLDYDFLFNYGVEIFFETARFWASRIEYSKEKKRYEINDVIGPDEYSEHVNNNAYTNYLVKWHLSKALEIATWLQTSKPEIWENIIRKTGLQVEELVDWEDKVDKIYTHINKESGLIYQFDGFMDKKDIDLSTFKGKVGLMVKKMGWDEVNNSMVLKQADVVMLMFLLRDQYSQKVKEVNWSFYEPRTLHDSSLSYSVHSIIATDINRLKEAYEYFIKAAKIDIGEDMKSSDDGLHAASLGGIWLAVINGFAGIKVLGDKLDIDPKLPEKWENLKFNIIWRGDRYNFEIDRGKIRVEYSSFKNKKSVLNILGKSVSLQSNKELIFNFKSLGE